MLTVAEHQITIAEERLRLAMLNSDVAVLDELISPDLIFTNHLGQIISKQDDLELHRSLLQNSPRVSSRRLSEGLES